MLFDRGIPLDVLARTFGHSGLKLTDLLSADVLRGVPRVAINLLGLRGARLRSMRRSIFLQQTERLFQ
jgi:hypothetical protein